MSASLVIGVATIPVSSRTSRKAALSAFSPGSTNPLGRQRTVLDLGRTARGAVSGEPAGALGSSMAAIHQTPSLLRTTTPPAEISRTILFATYQEYRYFV